MDSYLEQWAPKLKGERENDRIILNIQSKLCNEQLMSLLDALIIGGGPSGATAALLLAKAGWSIGIVEKKTFPRHKVCGEFISATSSGLLNQLGILDFYLTHGGPEIRQVGLYAGDTLLSAAMPAATHSLTQWGRALRRDYLDTALLNQAAKLGAKIWQPFYAKELQRKNDLFKCTIEADGNITELSARIIILAHGSWERPLVPQKVPVHTPSDLLAFKAHFDGHNLPLDTMPLLAFPGGYGGIVHCTNQLISLSCCIRRDKLQTIRQQCLGSSAAEAVFSHITKTCLGAKNILQHAKLQGNSLSIGPIHPGIRSCYKEGIFYIGNLAGEAHPIIAEGISMAMQSAWLLTKILIQRQKEIIQEGNTHNAGKEYTKQWKNHFKLRIYGSMLFAKWAIHPKLTHSLSPLFLLFPNLVTRCAILSGKIQQIVDQE